MFRLQHMAVGFATWDHARSRCITGLWEEVMKTFTNLIAGAIGVVALGGPALAQGKVVLYTAHKTSLVQKLAPQFEAETGIKTEVVQLGSSDIIRRARAEM